MNKLICNNKKPCVISLHHWKVPEKQTFHFSYLGGALFLTNEIFFPFHHKFFLTILHWGQLFISRCRNTPLLTYDFSFIFQKVVSRILYWDHSGIWQLGEVAIEQHFEIKGSWEQVKFPGLQNFKKLGEFF